MGNIVSKMHVISYSKNINSNNRYSHQGVKKDKFVGLQHPGKSLLVQPCTCGRKVYTDEMIRDSLLRGMDAVQVGTFSTLIGPFHYSV